MNIPLFLVGLACASFALSLLFAPIVWDIIRELFGAALVVLAIVLLAIAGLVTMAHAKQPNNFGLPPDIAAKVKAECAKVFPFYDTQLTCIEDDAKAYHRLQKNDFGLPAEIAEQVKVRCAEIFPFYDTQITCIEDDARAYKKLHGED
jgi:hypothetical protein